ncbi:MAG: BlaI/MecI/CopY family transcriptional regulator [Bryobacteraceae bacterium]
MPMKKLPRPTGSELEILQVLWRDGPSTVRAVQEALEQKRAMGYTTVLKLMQIMAGKGLVARDETGRAHVYRARLARQETQRQLLDDFLNRAFGGSAAALVMQALSGKRASAGEIAEIRRLLDEQESAQAAGHADPGESRVREFLKRGR